MDRSTELARNRPVLFGLQTFWPYNLIILNRQRCQGPITGSNSRRYLVSGAKLPCDAGATPPFTVGAPIASLKLRDFASEPRPLGSGLSHRDRVSRQKLPKPYGAREDLTIGSPVNFRIA